MRIVFAGTPDFAATALKTLLNAGYDIVGVYTQPDRPAGRGRKLGGPVATVVLDHQAFVHMDTVLEEDTPGLPAAGGSPGAVDHRRDGGNGAGDRLGDVFHFSLTC